jgi:hypothetical protein
MIEMDPIIQTAIGSISHLVSISVVVLLAFRPQPSRFLKLDRTALKRRLSVPLDGGAVEQAHMLQRSIGKSGNASATG